MTATSEDKPTLDIYGAFQRAFDHFNDRGLYPNRLPQALFTLYKKPRRAGHYCHDYFAHTSEQGRRTDEIMLNPLYFQARNLFDVLSTVAHEQMHLWQQHFGEPGKGAYHNKKWGDCMEAIGLMPSATGAPGGARTGRRVSHYIIPGGNFEVMAQELITSGFQIPWALNADIPRVARNPELRGGQRDRFSCAPCDQNTWGKSTLKVTCGICNTPMIRTA